VDDVHEPASELLRGPLDRSRASHFDHPATQVGIGFVHNSFRSGDTSWLVPVGLTVDYRVTRWLSVDGTFLMNFTDLDTGRGSGATFMPGFTLGVRF
jgi:hypothetical protein